MPRIKSLGTFLVLSVSIVISIAISGIIFYVMNSSYNLALDLEQQSMNQSTKNLSVSFVSFRENAVAMARSIAMQRVFKTAFNGEASVAQQRISDTLKADPSVWSAILFDTKGDIIAGKNASGEDLMGQNRSDRDYFKAIMAGKDLFYGDTILTARSGGKEMYIYSVAHTIRDESGAILGGIGIFTRWDSFTANVIDSQRFGARGYAFMLDSNGIIIAHGADKARVLSNVSGEGFVQQILSKKNGQLRYTWQGEDKYLDFRTDPSTGFSVCSNAYISDLASAAYQQRNVLLAIGGLSILLLCCCISFIIRKFVVNPILNIQKFTGLVRSGNFTSDLAGFFKFELLYLTEDISSMVVTLKEKLGFSNGVLNGFVLPCLVVNAKDEITFINEHMIRALEKPGAISEYLGMTSAEFIYGDRSRETLTAKALREKIFIREEIHYKTSSDNKIFDVSCTPFTDMDGNLLGTETIWFELTEIRTQQHKIEEQNGRIAEAARSANVVADKVTVSSENLAAQIDLSMAGSKEQHSRTEETATAMEEMNSTVAEVAHRAATAADLAECAKTEAQQGRVLVGDVVSTVHELSQQAESLKGDMAQLGRQAEGISQIMTVISDIADQTNLLALNAAIEAARAGDAGRGFAVVADEVRKLAEKTMTATNEVGKNIFNMQESARKSIANMELTVEKIQSGSEIAQKSGEALQRIVTIVDETSGNVHGIATASEQQSATSEEINRSVGEINKIAIDTNESMILCSRAIN